MSVDMKIVIVDDNAVIRKTLKHALEKMGYSRITEAKDGIQALSELKSSAHDLLISDWNMPNMDGITLLRMIRGDSELRDLPVLMVTAETERDQVTSAIRAGINDYIVKPFTEETLSKKVKRILEKGNVPTAAAEKKR